VRAARELPRTESRSRSTNRQCEDKPLKAAAHGEYGALRWRRASAGGAGRCGAGPSGGVSYLP
jgi:hypothetical protein